MELVAFVVFAFPFGLVRVRFAVPWVGGRACFCRWYFYYGLWVAFLGLDWCGGHEIPGCFCTWFAHVNCLGLAGLAKHLGTRSRRANVCTGACGRCCVLRLCLVVPTDKLACMRRYDTVLTRNSKVREILAILHSCSLLASHFDNRDITWPNFNLMPCHTQLYPLLKPLVMSVGRRIFITWASRSARFDHHPWWC
jgi:hypothetical protein